jgi:3-hydroxyisobutyrate dehydrogenase-like beta-hydroxyacid dehydrogenase
MTNPTSIGFLGLGHMGASMAERLLAPGRRRSIEYDAQGKSHISMGDFAIAMVDEVEHPTQIASASQSDTSCRPGSEGDHHG